MLTLFGSHTQKRGVNDSRFCDGSYRRNFLKIGALGFGGLTLSQLLRAQAEQLTAGKNSWIKTNRSSWSISREDLLIKTCMT